MSHQHWGSGSVGLLPAPVFLACFVATACLLSSPAASQVGPPSDVPKPPSGSTRAGHVGLAVLVVGGFATIVSRSFEDAGQEEKFLDRSYVDGFADVGNAYGDGRTVGAATLGFLVVGHVAHRPALSEVGTDLGWAMLSSSAMVWSLKTTVHRRRPRGGKHSFPSGHAAVAFSAAPVLQAHYGWRVGVPAYLLATATAAGRMEDGYHYLSDVVFGAALGIAAGTWSSHGHGTLGKLSVFAGPRQAGVCLGF